MPTVNDHMAREAAKLGLNIDDLGQTAQDAVAAVAAGLDNLLPAIGDNPEALLAVSAALRSYAAVCQEYADALAVADIAWRVQVSPAAGGEHLP